MHPGEQANLSQWRGQDGFFEIWFVVLCSPQSGEAYWFRYTLMAPKKGQTGNATAIVWGAACERGAPVRWGKRIHPISEFSSGPRDTFYIRIGESELGHGFLRGGVETREGPLTWDLQFEPSAKPAQRTASLLRRLPLPTHASHVHTEVPFTGTVTLGDTRRVHGAVGLQMHIYGTRQVEELAWVHSALFDEDPDAVLELIETRLDRRMGPIPVPPIASLYFRDGKGTLDDTGVGTMFRPTVCSPGPGVLDGSFGSSRRMVKLRAFAQEDQLAGYIYRDPTGREVCVAQSDRANVRLEIYSRSRPWGPWRPERVLTSRAGAALEFHAPEPVPGVAYIPWDEETVARVRVDEVARVEAPQEFIELPDAPGDIFALGLTYREHIRETGGDPLRHAPVVFRKSRRAWLRAASEARVSVPSTRAMYAALDEAEAGLGAKLRERLGFLPALMDWEGELGMLLLEDSPESGTPKVAWFIANDLTARSCQVLGEGTKDPVLMWAVAKSFDGFLPAAARGWRSPDSADPEWPDVTLVTRVNGVERQRSHVRDMVGTPREMLQRVSKFAGRPLRAGDVVLTGTPSGIAFQVPAWKRKLGDRFLDRFGKLDAAMGMYLKGTPFLRPGDRVEVDGGWLGSVRVRIDL